MPSIVTRAQWGARHPDGFGPAPLPATEVWLHHSATSESTTIRQLEDIGQSRFGGGVSYTFLLAKDGTIYQGHSIGRRGAHTRGHNTQGRAICLIGNYDATPPSDVQLSSAASLLASGAALGWWRQPRLTGGHRDVFGTACPGQRAYDLIPEINRRAAGGAANQEDDVLPDERNALISVYRQVFFDTATVPVDLTPEYGTSINEQLARIRADVDAIKVTLAGGDPGLVQLTEADRLAIAESVADELARRAQD